jgi:hypothetical protein
MGEIYVVWNRIFSWKYRSWPLIVFNTVFDMSATWATQINNLLLHNGTVGICTKFSTLCSRRMETLETSVVGTYPADFSTIYLYDT